MEFEGMLIGFLTITTANQSPQTMYTFFCADIVTIHQNLWRETPGDYIRKIFL